MKKTFYLLLFIGLFIFSCRRYVDCLDNYHYNGLQPGLTLNGVDEVTAKSMMENYVRLKAQDASPTRESVWFDSVSFHKMVALLLKENANDPTVDGMRVYFVSKPNLVNNHMVNSVVFVSTKDAGPFPLDRHQRLHQDYYPHDRTDILFANTDLLKGLEEKRPWPVTNIFRGQNLYNVYFGRDSEKLKTDTHYISRAKAHAMTNQFGRDTMRTKGEWFDLPLLKALDSIPHDGLRIYFARHDTSYHYKGHPTTKDPDALKEAFVLIPTTAVGISGKKHKDNFSARLILDATIKKLYKATANKYGIGPMLVDSTGGDDDGSLCPVNCTPNPR